ncbi:hypothetical protein P5663_21345 [Priestia flexa]|uniref:hypothetical protein n=1 Tax=Priestia flexa TaxID=86664 RepID=UPI003D8A3707
MTSIKLNYEDVMQKLEDVETAIQKLSLPGTSMSGITTFQAQTSGSHRKKSWESF